MDGLGNLEQRLGLVREWILTISVDWEKAEPHGLLKNGCPLCSDFDKPSLVVNPDSRGAASRRAVKDILRY